MLEDAELGSAARTGAQTAGVGMLGAQLKYQNPNKDYKPTALDRAKAVIYGEREKTYGNPAKNINVIAEYWSTHLSAAKGQNIRLTVEDVCVMMILLKQARLANSPKHVDSIDDTIGYAALLDRIHSEVPTLNEVVGSTKAVHRQEHFDPT
jgi:hypothetical protein